MNEFTVWNKSRKEFIEEKYLNMYASSADGKYFFDCSDPYEYSDTLYSENSYEIFNYIGLTDIDCKKIYVDCSIVEFLESDGSVYAKGYFVYDDKLLSYKVFDLDDNVFYKYSDFIAFKTKVIDTIQENKLGFIK
jgi:hypothetical protein